METEGIRTHWSMEVYYAPCSLHYREILEKGIECLKSETEAHQRYNGGLYCTEHWAHVGSLDDNVVMSLSRDHPLGTSREEHWSQNMLLCDHPQ